MLINALYDKKIYSLLLIYSLSVLPSCGQDIESNSDKFLRFLNNYQTDSLANSISDSFHILRTFTKYSNDKFSFLNTYVPDSKNTGGQFEILNAVKKDNTTNYLVKDKSFYFKYLNIDLPKWKIAITCNAQNKIESYLYPLSNRR